MNSSTLHALPFPAANLDPVNPPPDPSRQTLLIVDDEEGPRQSLRVVFKEDYNLLIASDGLRALELAQQHKINAAVVDIRMTGMNGTEVLEKLKAIQPTIEVIMLTAYETVDTIRRALRLGACDYLNKPFDIATIRKAVATAMERHSFDRRNPQQQRKAAGAPIRAAQPKAPGGNRPHPRRDLRQHHP
jgi:DNA-binding NtrC family response regulator